MGLVYLNARIINPADRKKSERAEFVVDSGAVYSVVPKSLLKRLGIRSGANSAPFRWFSADPRALT